MRSIASNVACVESSKGDSDLNLALHWCRSVEFAGSESGDTCSRGRSPVINVLLDQDIIPPKSVRVVSCSLSEPSINLCGKFVLLQPHPS